jgi:hypothetical protein
VSPCTRGPCMGPCVHVHGSSRDAWHWPGGESSEEGGAGLRHCAVAAVAASLPLRRHHRRHSRCRLHLHRPASPPSHQRCRRHQPSTSLPPIAAAHAASVAAASIDRVHRSLPAPPLASPPLPKGEAARERERERSRLYGYKVKVRVRVRERVATSQSGGPWRNRTSTTLRP